MYRIVATIFVLLVGTMVSAQNLVPNPSFEENNNCPQGLSGIAFSKTYSNFPTVKAWSSPVKNSTPDYYTGCIASGLGVKVPLNIKGYQQPRTGDAYAGIIVYNQFTTSTSHYYSEYLYCKLNTKLVAGATYNVSFYVSATYPGLSTDIYCAIDRIGAYFSDTVFYTETNDYLVSQYHVKSTPGVPLDDTGNWVEISGSYTAHGGEEYMVIGNLDDQSNFNVKDFFPDQPSIYKQSYYYIDDVSVIRKPECDTFYSKRDTFFCHHDSLVLTSNAVGANSYTWGQGQSTGSITVYEPGVYWCTATSDTCDYYVDSFVVKTQLSEQINKKDSTICLYDSLTIQLRSTALSGERFTWNTGATTAAIDIKDTGRYWCRAVESCIVYNDTFTIDHKPFDHKVDIGNDTILCKGIEHALGIDMGVGVQYDWSNGSDSCCIVPTTSGQYELTITDGCTVYSDDVVIKIDECIECIFIPTAFTPNNDGRNDVLRAYDKCGTTKFELQIFNRWGEVVFETDNITTGWDGVYKNARAEVGAYFYLIRYSTSISNEQKVLKGNITLIR